jgi:ABC-type antimicrobial peptide transport system permease subunit
MDNFSYVAVLIGGIAFFALGAVWYSFLFQKPWAADMGIDMSDGPAKPPVGPLAGTFVVALIVAYIVEFFVRDGDLGFGLCRGALVGIAMAAVVAQNGFFDQRPNRLTWINAGFPLVGGILVGVIASAL